MSAILSRASYRESTAPGAAPGTALFNALYPILVSIAVPITDYSYEKSQYLGFSAGWLDLPFDMYMDDWNRSAT